MSTKKKKRRPGAAEKAGWSRLILRLRKRGSRNNEIADLLGLPYSRVTSIAAGLFRQGLLPESRGRPPRLIEPATMHREGRISSLSIPRVFIAGGKAKYQEQLMAMRKAGLRNRDIAKRLGISFYLLTRIIVLLHREKNSPRRPVFTRRAGKHNEFGY